MKIILAILFYFLSTFSYSKTIYLTGLNITDTTFLIKADQFTEKDCIYIINKSFDLRGDTLNIPDGCLLKLNEEGKLFNGYFRVRNSSSIMIDGYGFQLNEINKDFDRTRFINYVYVDPMTNITNGDGSPKRPYKSLNNALLFSNSVLIKKGTSLDNNLELSYNRNRQLNGLINIPHNCFIGTYGKGRAPILNGFATIYTKDLQHKQGYIYLLEFLYSPLYWDNDKSKVNLSPTLCNIGNIMSSPSSHRGVHYKELGDLSEEGDFYNIQYDRFTSYADYYKVYFYSKRKYSKYYISVGLNAIYCNLVKVSINGLEIKGFGRHAICALGSGSEIENCFIHYIGGSVLENDSVKGFTLYGNGIECYTGKGFTYQNINIRSNIIEDCYDAAITLQGNGKIHSCSILKNVIKRSPLGIEFWGDVYDVQIKGNRIYNCQNKYSLWNYPVNGTKNTIRWIYGAFVVWNNNYSGKISCSNNEIYDSPIIGCMSDTPNVLNFNRNIINIRKDDKIINTSSIHEIIFSSSLKNLSTRLGTGNRIKFISK